MTDHEKAFQSHEQSLALLLETELLDFMPALGQARFFESDPSLRAAMLREELPLSLRVQKLILKMQMSGEMGYDRMLKALKDSRNDRLVELADKIQKSLTRIQTTSIQEALCPKEESSECSVTTSHPVFPVTGSHCQDVCGPLSSMDELDEFTVSTRQRNASKWLSTVPKGRHSREHDDYNKETFEWFIALLRDHCADDRPVREETADPSNWQRAKECYLWKVLSHGLSPLKSHPDAIYAKDILSSHVRSEVYTVLYRRRRADSKAAEELVQECLQLNIPTDLKVVVASAGLSRRNESENVLPILFELLKLVEKGECNNYDIAVCTLRVHIASVCCHKGDLQMARKEITPGLQSAMKISDPAVVEAGWVHGWLLFLEGQQGEKAFAINHEKAIDDVYSQTLGRLQNEQRWFRDLSEAFKLGKADTHLRIARQHIAVEGSHDSEVVYQLLQRARDSLLSIDMDLLRQSHGNDPFTEAFRNHLWFMYHHLQGNHSEADTFLHPAFDNWIEGKGYKFAREIAEMANKTHLLQQLKELDV